MKKRVEKGTDDRYRGLDAKDDFSGIYCEYVNKIYAYNNTFVNCRVAFGASSGGNTLAINNIVQNANDGFSGTFDGDSDYNCSDITSDAPGANSVTGNVTFVSEGTDDFRLDSADTVAKDVGLDLSTDVNFPFNTDIVGNTRESGSWDIGAIEAVLAAVAEQIRRIYRMIL